MYLTRKNYFCLQTRSILDSYAKMIVQEAEEKKSAGLLQVHEF